MTVATSPQSMKSLRDTLTTRFGFQFEDRRDMARGIDSEELNKLTDTILQLRKDQNRAHEELRAQNDALHVLRVLRMRKKEDRDAASPFGYRTWWLTQESKSGFAMDRAFPAKKGIRSIIRPEFLLNYITYNPTTNEVKESLRTRVARGRYEPDIYRANEYDVFI
jgi:hypothetical protein